MSTETQLVIRPHSIGRRGAHQITWARSRDWARPWPREAEVSPLFRLAALPIRLVALSLLWATSTPGRLLFAVGVSAAVTIALIAH